MLKFLADENFNNDIVRGLIRENPQIDIIRVQEVSLVSVEDPVILEWAAKEDRILLTHDVHTMPAFAYDRVKDGLPMPGVFAVRKAGTPLGQAISELRFLAEGSFDSEYNGLVIYVPLHW
jgi:Domain of unknown function (DUF5615)